MIINRQKTTEISGSSSQPGLNGAYLYIYLKEELVTIVSIPSPNVVADNSNQSTVENFDDFTDKYGNNYSITVFSSIYDIYWSIETDTTNNDIINNFRYEVKYNEY